MDNSIEKEIKSLLYNFWIVKDNNPELYYKIKYNQNAIKDFIVKNLGSKLIIHDRFIKLEKIPTILNKNNGINNFIEKLDYIILTIILMYLEDKTRGDKFVLSNLIEYIKNTALTMELDNIPDWNKINDRKSLVRAITYLNEIGVIKVKDESKIKFSDDKNAEALYEATGLSNYVMRIFDGNINTLEEPNEFIKSEFITQDDEKGDIRRYRVFRNILYTPSVSFKNISLSDIDYIRKNRGYIKGELSKKINMDVEITYNMATLFDDINSQEKDNFPNNKKLTEIVLMINSKILEDIKQEKILLDDFETAKVSEVYIENVIKNIKLEKTPYIGKTYLSETDDKFYKDVFEYMEKYNLIEKVEDGIIIYPMISRLIGKTIDIKTSNSEQLDLFGGENEL